MKKCILFVLIISCHGFWKSAEKRVEGEKAEKIFVSEMKSKTKLVEDLKQQLEMYNERLNIRNFLSLKVLLQLFHVFSKVQLIVTTLWNIYKKIDTGSKLNKAELNLEVEHLLDGFWPDGEKVCEKAFKNSFFKEKGWTLDEKDTDTKSTSQHSINVIDKQGDKYFRPTKICEASEKGESFPVHISAAQNFNWEKNFAFYVFIKGDKNFKVLAYLVNENK